MKIEYCVDSVKLDKKLNFFLWQKAFAWNVEILWDQTWQLPSFKLFNLGFWDFCLLTIKIHWR